MPPLPPRDGVAAPPCAGIRAGASTVSPDDSPDGVVGVQVSPYQQRAEHDAIGGLSGTFGIAFPSLLRACHRPWYWRETYPDYGASN